MEFLCIIIAKCLPMIYHDCVVAKFTKEGCFAYWMISRKVINEIVLI